MNTALLSSKKMDYCTPQDFFDSLNTEFHFALDAAATKENAKCRMFYTLENDGLKNPWNVGGGAVFCNPPYGREIGKWVRKAYEEAQNGYTGNQKSGLSVDGCTSPMKKTAHTRPRRSRRWWLSITAKGRMKDESIYNISAIRIRGCFRAETLRNPQATY